MKFNYHGRIVAARNKAEACRKVAASASRIHGSARFNSRRVTASAEKFIEGLENHCDDKDFVDCMVSEKMGDVANWAPSSDWDIRSYDHKDKLVFDIKMKGMDSALDHVKLEGIELWDILNQENGDFLNILADEIQDQFGMNLYQYGRSGGWLGFDLDECIAERFFKVTLKKDAETMKAIADTIRKQYASDDTEFTGNESVEELVAMLDIDDWQEGYYIDEDMDWFDVELSDDGYRVMKYVEDSIKGQCDYMLTKEWLDNIVDTYSLVLGSDGVYRKG